MPSHPLHGVAVVGLYNTKQARVLEGETALSITMAAARGAIADAEVDPQTIDGICDGGKGLAYHLGIGPAWVGGQPVGIAGLLEAASAIVAGLCTTCLVTDGSAGLYTDRSSTAPWTRPSSEFVETWGMFTAAEFGLIARRHMDLYGTGEKQMATVAATIRNNGHVNPEAVYYGRGPYSVDDILASRMIAEPFHLLDCATTSEGACGVVLTTAERARDLPHPPIYLLGGGIDYFGNQYEHAPSFDLVGRDPAFCNGYVGRAAAQRSFRMAGCGPADVDVCEFYDPFSFEIIRQFEAFGFCDEGAGGDFVTSGVIGPGGRYPITTDGGTMSFSHTGSGSQNLQRVARSVSQLRGDCQTMQVPDARIAMCSNGGAGALMTRVLLLGRSQP